MTEYVLEEGRRAARARMVDLCVVTRPTGELVTDPETGEVTQAVGDPVYQGACRVQVESDISSQADAGEARYELLTVVVSVPVSRVVYKQGDVVEILRSRNDPALAGRRYRVMSVVSKSHATARRLRCEEGVA